MDWEKLWNDIVGFFKANVWNIVFFFVILFVGIIVIKILLAITRKLLGATKMEKIAQQFVCTIFKFVLWLALILLLLTQIGVEITGLLTALSAVILAVGMALQNAIANVANGIIIISSHMFKKNDYIIVGGVEGKITDINFMFTTLITNDNKKITLPNSSIINNSVTNLGAEPKRRVDFTFSVAYESDVELVKKVVTDAMKSDGRVYLDPVPFCKLKELNASSIDFFANCWCDNADYWDVYYYVIENVYNEFKRNKISVPYTQLEIRERKDKVTMPVVGKKLPARVEKQRDESEKIDLEKDGLATALKKAKKNKELKKAKKEKKAEAAKQEKVAEEVKQEPVVEEKPKKETTKAAPKTTKTPAKKKTTKAE